MFSLCFILCSSALGHKIYRYRRAKLLFLTFSPLFSFFLFTFPPSCSAQSVSHTVILFSSESGWYSDYNVKYRTLSPTSAQVLGFNNETGFFKPMQYSMCQKINLLKKDDEKPLFYVRYRNYR